MAANRPKTGLKFTVILILFIVNLAQKPVVGYETVPLEYGKKVGSRPPECVSKCLSCKPCIATLVIQQRQPRFRNPWSNENHDHGKYDEEGDTDSYYLLSWKCKCGTRLFQP